MNFINYQTLLSSVGKWPKNTILLLKGKHKIENIKRSFNHLHLEDKVIWSDENLSQKTSFSN